jgi:hypothetical protein
MCIPCEKKKKKEQKKSPAQPKVGHERHPSSPFKKNTFPSPIDMAYCATRAKPSSALARSDTRLAGAVIITMRAGYPWSSEEILA